MSEKTAMEADKLIHRELQAKLNAQGASPLAAKKFRIDAQFMAKFPNHGVQEVQHDGPPTAYKDGQP